MSFGFTLFSCSIFLVATVWTNGAASSLCQPSEKDCGSELGSVEKVQVNGTCLHTSAGVLAILKRGTHVLVNFTFKPTNDETKLTSKVAGIIGGVKVNFPLPNPNACVDSNVKCPVTGGKTYNYTPVLNVETLYPTIRLVVQWELHNADGKIVFCVRIPAQIE